MPGPNEMEQTFFADPALDFAAGRPDTADDLPARPCPAGSVQALLYRRSGGGVVARDGSFATILACERPGRGPRHRAGAVARGRQGVGVALTTSAAFSMT